MQTQTRRIMLRSLIGVGACAAFPQLTLAGHGCCHRCGCSANRCRKICRLVREDRKIATTVWGMECEDICVPGPSTPDCKQCEMVGGPAPGDKVCSKPKRIVWTSWIPGCDQEIRTKRKLMKKTVKTTVPSFKWVVEDLCAECTAAIEPLEVPIGTTLPAAPNIEGATVIPCSATQEIQE